jgi:ribosomal-protein-alanine N-acetyltransferase
MRKYSHLLLTLALATLLTTLARAAELAWPSQPLRQSTIGMVQSLPQALRPEILRYLGAQSADPNRLVAALAQDPTLTQITPLEAQQYQAALIEKIARPVATPADLYQHAGRMQVVEALLSRNLPASSLPQVRIAAQIAREAAPIESRPKLEARMQEIARRLQNYNARPSQDPTPALEPAHAKDLAGILAIERQVFPRNERWSLAEYRDALLKPSSTVKVIRNNGAVVANSVSTRRGGNLYIDNVSVHPDFMGQGYGTALMRDVFQAALDNPAIRTITLHVDAGNKVARALYDKLGFAVTRVVRNYYAKGKDALYMSFAVRPPARKADAAPNFVGHRLTDLKEMQDLLLRLKTSSGTGRLDGARVMIKYTKRDPSEPKAIAEAQKALTAGLPLDVFTGVLTTVTRNRRGQLYFRMITLERTDGKKYLPRAFNTVEGKLHWLQVLDEGSAE